jgi:hypothetical protein
MARIWEKNISFKRSRTSPIPFLPEKSNAGVLTEIARGNGDSICVYPLRAVRCSHNNDNCTGQEIPRRQFGHMSIVKRSMQVREERVLGNFVSDLRCWLQ